MTFLIIFACVFLWLLAGYLGGWLVKLPVKTSWDHEDERINRILIIFGPIYLLVGILFMFYTFLNELKNAKHFRSWWP